VPLSQIILESSPSGIQIAFFVFLCGLIALGVWEKILFLLARGWPVAEATIDAAWIQEYSGKRRYWMARLDYSFLLRGRRYTGRYSREFSYEDDAEEFVRDLQGKPLLIHHSSRWPMLSMAFKDDVEALLLTRSPELPTDPGRAVPLSKPVPLYKKLLAYPLMLVALAGFLLSLYVHIATWLGQIVLPESWQLPLHAGMFVPFFAAIFIAPRAPRRRRNANSALEGFVGTAMAVVLVYAMANFVLFMVNTALSHNHATHLQTWRGFSGHWMVFYFWSFGFLYTAVYPTRQRQD